VCKKSTLGRARALAAESNFDHLEERWKRFCMCCCKHHFLRLLQEYACFILASQLISCDTLSSNDVFRELIPPTLKSVWVVAYYDQRASELRHIPLCRWVAPSHSSPCSVCVCWLSSTSTNMVVCSSPGAWCVCVLDLDIRSCHQRTSRTLRAEYKGVHAL